LAKQALAECYTILHVIVQCIVGEDRSVTPEWPHLVDHLHRSDQPLKCCCCPCGAGQSIGYWDGLGDTSSIVQGGGNRVTDRCGTGALGAGLMWLRRAWQCDQRQNSSGVWWDPTLGRDGLMTKQLSFWHGPANVFWLFGIGTSCESLQTFCVGSE